MSTQEMQARLDELGAARRAYDSDNTMLGYNRIVNAEHEIKHRAVKDVAHLLEINAQLQETVEHYQADVANNYKLMALYQEQRDMWMEAAQDTATQDVLLDALERLVHMAECNTTPGPNTLAQARAAIAKAREGD